ncbi:MAG: hypothetical protein O8C66_02975 [Candidatus Methanoperedens sp.]|nr:hypothetical protein [Candidatus Methanoperedens sp.]MCZ7369450.1 hypothetical protein [Candidatus Methanoperedens sp.]
MKSFTKGEDAVSMTLAYILFSGIFMVFSVIVLLNANDILIKGPSNIVVKEQYRGIGNLISSTITDMYLIAPENGYIETEYKIPSEIGRETYIINADLAGTDEIIDVNSTTTEKSVSVTINGIASSMLINGTAYSSNSTHWISYDSRR